MQVVFKYYFLPPFELSISMILFFYYCHWLAISFSTYSWFYSSYSDYLAYSFSKAGVLPSSSFKLGRYLMIFLIKLFLSFSQGLFSRASSLRAISLTSSQLSKLFISILLFARNIFSSLVSLCTPSMSIIKFDLRFSSFRLIRNYKF